MTTGQEQTTAAMLTPAERAARGRAARGDAHLSNFGLFGSPERCLVFDLNDFDETLPGPFEGDVKRLAASLSVAGRDNGHDDAERRRVVLAATEAYRTAMAAFAGMGNLGVWYARLDVEEVLPPVRGRARPPARQGPAGQPGQGQGPATASRR